MRGHKAATAAGEEQTCEKDGTSRRPFKLPLIFNPLAAGECGSFARHQYSYTSRTELGKVMEWKLMGNQRKHRGPSGGCAI